MSVLPKFTGTLKKAQALSYNQQRRKKLIYLPLVALQAVAASTIYIMWRNQPQRAADILKVSGRIEGYETEIGVKHTGRIESIAVREGAAVKKGQDLIKLDDSNYKLLQEQLLSAEARIASAQFNEQQALSDVERVQAEIEQVESQISEAKLNKQQSVGDALGRIEQAQFTVATARAQLLQAQAQVKQAEAEVKLALINRDRYVKLVLDGAINQQQFDQAQTTFDTAVATLEARKAAVYAAREQLNVSLGGLTQAKTTGLNPSIRSSQLEALNRKKQQSDAQLKSARAKVKSASALVKDAIASKQQIGLCCKNLLRTENSPERELVMQLLLHIWWMNWTRSLTAPLETP